MSPEPYRCPKLYTWHLEEYRVVEDLALADQLLAWVREADRACRANQALIKE